MVLASIWWVTSAVESVEALVNQRHVDAALESSGYPVVRVLSAESLERLWPDSAGQVLAILFHIEHQAERSCVTEVLRVLEGLGAWPPLLVGGGGADESFALDVAASAVPAPYQGGVLYWESVAELLQILQYIVGPQAGAAGAGSAQGQPASESTSCSSCGGCLLGGTGDRCGSGPDCPKA